MFKSGSLYKYGKDAAAFVGMSETDFLREVEQGRAPRPVSSNVPDHLKFWRSRDLASWMKAEADPKIKTSRDVWASRLALAWKTKDRKMDNTTKPKPAGLAKSEAQFRRYTGWQAIPLYRATDTKKIKGKVVKLGKRPLHFNWTKRRYDTGAVIEQCVDARRNMGVRLRPADLVLDVDTRRDGMAGLADLALDAGLDLCTYPRVVTGSGGFHLYGKKPAGLAIVDSLPTYSGVEFKSKGRQVVSAGSIHPDTGKPYQFDDDFPALDDAPEWPKELLELIARPAVETTIGGGQYDQEQVAKMLDRLDPEDFRDHGVWLQLMMACHHASSGDARSEFIEWSTQDPNYADEGEMIGRRWDSLHSNKAGGVTYKTLNKILMDHDAADAIPAADASEDFEAVEDESWLEGDEAYEPASDEDMTWLEKLNVDYCAVTTGGKYRIMYQARNAKGPDWEWMNKSDFLSLHENRRVLDPHAANKTVPLGQAWQQWPGRRTASGTTFDATLEAGALDANNRLNLWLGWAVPPSPGKWPRFEAMIRDDICSGESKAAEYFFNWAAWKFQHPAELPEAAFAMRGNKGTGKGTLGEAFVNIFGNHGIATSSMDHVFGRFNGHMERVLFAFADEAFWAGDPRQDARLKKLVTDRDAMFEHKNIQPYAGINRTAVMLATNDDWVVPATEGERRYCVVRTSDQHQCPEGEPNHPNRPYWNAIYGELRNGGLAAFLHDMLHRELPAGWHPRAHVPLTQELANQKARSLKGIVGFYFERLQTGQILETVEGTSQAWDRGDLRVSPSEFWEACRDWIHATQPRATVTRRGVSNELKRFGWDVGDHLRHGKARDRYWLCPALVDARARFDEMMKGKMFD